MSKLLLDFVVEELVLITFGNKFTLKFWKNHERLQEVSNQDCQSLNRGKQ
jgi:hypothetical protein